MMTSSVQTIIHAVSAFSGTGAASAASCAAAMTGASRPSIAIAPRFNHVMLVEVSIGGIALTRKSPPPFVLLLS